PLTTSTGSSAPLTTTSTRREDLLLASSVVTRRLIRTCQPRTIPVAVSSSLCWELTSKASINDALFQGEELSGSSPFFPSSHVRIAIINRLRSLRCFERISQLFVRPEDVCA